MAVRGRPGTVPALHAPRSIPSQPTADAVPLLRMTQPRLARPEFDFRRMTVSPVDLSAGAVPASLLQSYQQIRTIVTPILQKRKGSQTDRDAVGTPVPQPPLSGCLVTSRWPPLRTWGVHSKCEALKARILGCQARSDST